MTHAEIERMYRLIAVYLGITFGVILFSALTGCNADCASPFEKPDVTTEPVNCGAGCQS